MPEYWEETGVEEMRASILDPNLLRRRLHRAVDATGRQPKVDPYGRVIWMPPDESKIEEIATHVERIRADMGERFAAEAAIDIEQAIYGVGRL